MRIPSNVVAFAQDKVSIYEAFRDYFNHYRAQNGNTKVDYDKNISFEEKNTKMHKALLSEISRLTNINAEGLAPEVLVTNPNYKWATFAVIDAMIDIILPETLIDSIGIYTDIRTGGYADSFSFDVKSRDLFVVSKAGKGKRLSELHKQFEGQVTLVPYEHDITVAVSLYRVLAGEENLAEFVLKATQSIETEMTVDAYNQFNTALGNLALNVSGEGLRVSGYSQDEAVRLAQSVTAFNQGSKAVFVGTQRALRSLLPTDTNYRYMLDSDYVKIGYVRTAFGYDVMVLPQVADWKNPFKVLLDDKKIYVVSPSSQKIVKLCLGGATIAIASDVYQYANLTQTTTLKKLWVAGVATNAVAGRIDLA